MKALILSAAGKISLIQSVIDAGFEVTCADADADCLAAKMYRFRQLHSYGDLYEWLHQYDLIIHTRDAEVALLSGKLTPRKTLLPLNGSIEWNNRLELLLGATVAAFVAAPRVFSYQFPRKMHEKPMYFSDPIQKCVNIAMAWLDNSYYQETIEAQEYTVDCLSDLEGNFLQAVPRLRVKTENGESCRTLIADQEDPKIERMMQEAGRICNYLKLRGPSCLQCFDAETPLWFDINLRWGGASIASSKAGLDTWKRIYHMVRGDPPNL